MLIVDFAVFPFNNGPLDEEYVWLEQRCSLRQYARGEQLPFIDASQLCGHYVAVKFDHKNI